MTRATSGTALGLAGDWIVVTRGGSDGDQAQLLTEASRAVLAMGDPVPAS